jgi:hypothetical protein
MGYKRGKEGGINKKKRNNRERKRMLSFLKRIITKRRKRVGLGES